MSSRPLRQHSANWRRRFFYAAEATFAIIAGLGEAAIYYAYLPPSVMRWPEAIARATITQLAIILFGVAAVEAAKRARTLAGKIAATMPANLATGVFSLVAFWFLRDAAIIYRDGSTLAPAEAFSFTLPNGVTLTGQEIDIYLIAALPLFQVMLNWLAPIIVQDALVESDDARRDREARELADLAHEAERQRALAAIGAAKAAGRRRAVLAYAGREPQAENALAESPDTPDGDDQPAPDGVGSGGERAVPDDGDAGDRPPEQAPTTPAKSVRPRRGDQGDRERGAHLVSTGMWTATDLARYVRDRYGVEMSDDAAVAALAQMPHVERLAGVKGNPYGAPKREVRAWADRKFEQPTLRLTAG